MENYGRTFLKQCQKATEASCVLQKILDNRLDREEVYRIINDIKDAELYSMVLYLFYLNWLEGNHGEGKVNVTHE